MGRLVGKRALITGGGSGIGAETARRFAHEGARVLTCDVKGGDLATDIRDATQVATSVEEAVVRFGGLDSVVCNAGRPILGTVAELDEADWDDGLAVNLKGIYHCARAAWPHLVESKGSILVTASIVGRWGSPGQAAYCASKAAAIMLTKCMALDGARDGVRANCVCPGFVETPLLDDFMAGQPNPEAARAGAIALHPLGRLGQPRDIADAFVYLASDQASWVTGAALSVDGGLTSGIWGG